MTKEELKQELHHYIATQCSEVSINSRNRLVYHYVQMEKVGEFIYNLEEKRITELEKENAKAKEIIKTFCGLCSVFNSSNGSFDNLIAKAEAFLNKETE